MSSTEAPGGAAPLSPLKRAFLALEAAEARVADLERDAAEPIAIVGLACRVPGADDPQGFWTLLREGRDSVGPTPPDRWDAEALYDPNPDVPGRIAAKRAGYLRGPVDAFDAELFGIAPREAQGMDPQQRLLLEVAWEALENAGKASDRLERSATGVYVGLGASDYANLQLKTHDPALLDTHFASGIAHSIASGRISYLLGLQGPSITLDTACSSSLVAVHLACQALRSRDCTMALAGGVHLMLAPDLYIALSRARMLSPEGRCKTFDASADGFARGEGCGVVVLKRLRDAQADGDRIHAVIRGSAVNQDGPSGSLTAPNGPAQQAVIRKALERAGLSPRDVGYIEAHGTGTELGDPLEVQALGAVFGEGRDPAKPLWLASVKTNIGHLEAAAGVVALIKLVLSLEHRELPQHLHFRNPSPHIPWADLPFRVPTALVPWAPINGRRIGGVSSFGFSGTNAHLVVEEAPAALASPLAPEGPPAPANPLAAPTDGTGGPHLFVLSGKTERALRQVAERYASAVLEREDAHLADLCFTAAVGRAHLPWRAAVIARTPTELTQGLAAIGRGETAEGVVGPRVAPRDPPRIAFLFTGQGSQYVGMARELYESQPEFRSALDRVATLLAPSLAVPLLAVLFPPAGVASPLDETAYTQPALFAIEYALAALWASWGVHPSMVIGHSVGEFAAAVAAGVFRLEDAVRLVAARGRLMQSLPAGGAMTAIFAPEARVAEALRAHGSRVTVAAVNAPDQTVISGAAVEVDAVARDLAAQGVRTKPLVVSHAFHSSLVDPILAAFEREAATIDMAPPRLPLVSNVTGRVAEAAVITEASYWRRHIREGVRFADGLRSLAALQPGVAIEIGPQPTLLTFAKAAFEESLLLVPSLRNGRADAQTLLEAAALLHVAGVPLDFRAMLGGPGRRVVDLPTYPFQRERFWFRSQTFAVPAPGRSPALHPLLGARVRSAGTETIYEAAIGADAPAFVRQHRAQDRVLLPATAYLEAFLAAAEQTFGSPHVTVADVTVGEALILDEDGALKTVQLVVGPVRDGSASASLSSLAASGDAASGEDPRWVVHATARIFAGRPSSEPAPALALLRDGLHTAVEPSAHYAGFERRGLMFGPDFEVVRSLSRGPGAAAATLALSDAFAAEVSAYRVHPVLLDGCLQTIAAALSDEQDDVLYLPIGVGSYTRYGDPGSRAMGYASVDSGAGELRRARILLFDETGSSLLAELRDVQVKRVGRDALARLGERRLDDAFYEIAWRDAPRPAPEHAPAGAKREAHEWLVFADRGGFAADVAARLTAAGDRCTVVTANGTAHTNGDVSTEATLADSRELLRTLRAAGRAPDRVIHAASLDAAAWESAAETDVEAASRRLDALLALAQALVVETPASRLWVLTRGAQQAGILDRALDPLQAPVWGFCKTLRHEHPEVGCACVDVDAGDAAAADAVAAELCAAGEEPEVALRGDARRVPRLVRHVRRPADRAGASDATAYRLAPLARGSLDAFVREPLARRAPGSAEVEIRVEATGLNFRDVMNVLGMYPGDPGPLGGECAGTVVAVGSGVSHVSPGDAVVAVAPGSFASHVVAQAELVRRRPGAMSAEEGAAFSIAYLTAAFCLEECAKVRAGDRVLIHAAAGGVGMAAVHIALRAGAEVFATAGSPAKRDLLRSIGVAHALDSRSTSFASDIERLTGGRGVDVVLNSLAGDLLDASFRVLADGGRFVEIGKRGIKDASWVAALGRGHAYFIVDWSENAAREPERIGALFARLLDDWRTGALPSLPRHAFPLDEATRAFRFMAQARHVGRIVVRHALAATPPPVRADGTYVVTGGLSGLGLSVARWLVEQGAGRVVLLGRRPVTPEVNAAIEPLRSRGATVVAESLDVTDEAALAALFARLRREGPAIRGIVHSAGVLDDAGLLEQSAARFARVLAPKVTGGWLLDKLTRGDALDWFVVFSSIAAVLGAPGQANYSAANAFLDGLARERRSRGLPGLSVDWGAWSDVGVAADRRTLDRLAARGIAALTPAQGCAALERLLGDDAPQVAVVLVDWRRYLSQAGNGAAAALLADLAGARPAASGGLAAQTTPKTNGASPSGSFLEHVAAQPHGRRRPMVATFVRERALAALGLDPTRALDPETPLGDLGLDSLLSIELRNTLSAALGKPLPASLLFDYPTVNALIAFIWKDVLGESVADAPAQATPAAAQAPKMDPRIIDAIEELSDEEVERQLAALSGSKAR